MGSLEAFERRAFSTLTALAATTLAALPVLPGHDLPQHLAYLRLVAGWQDDPGALSAIYAPPDLSNPYATTYRVVAPLARVVGAEACVRVVLFAYVVLLSVAVRELVRATWPRDERAAAPASALLGPVVAFSPVLCMGFLPYLVALVPATFAIAWVVSFLATGRRRALVLAAVATMTTSALHGVAAAAALGFVGLLLLLRRDVRALAAVFACTSALLVGSRLFGSVASLPPGFGGVLLANVRSYGLLDGVTGSFRMSFASPVLKLDYVLAAVLGPFPTRVKLASAVVLLLIGVAAWRARTHVARSASPVRGVRPACAVFALLAVLAPAAVQVPDDLSLLDFRLVTHAVVLAVAVLPPHGWARSPRSLRTLAFASLALLAIWGRQLAGISGELGPAVRLLARLGPRDRLLALPMHDDSAFLEEANAVLHYDAVFHTARTGGVTSLFWAKFSPRLPVGYRPGREPSRPPDWAPWALEDGQLAGYSHVLVRWPAPDEEDRMHALAARVVDLRARGVLGELACDEGCCLFGVDATRAAAPAAVDASAVGLR